jgi:hypothetical protein
MGQPPRPVGLLAFSDLARLDREVEGDLRIYFAFVEGWSGFAPPPEKAEVRPVDLPDDRDHVVAEWMAGREWRCRLSGLRVSDFEGVADAIRELDHTTVTDEERNERRVMLNEMLGGVPIPVIDMFLGAGTDDKSASAWRETLHSSRWLTMVLRRVVDVPPWGIPVLLADPELEDDEPLTQWIVADLFRPPEHASARLRDIFSLVHVPDANLEDDGFGGDPAPPGSDDPDRDSRATGLVGAPDEQSIMRLIARRPSRPPLRRRIEEEPGDNG